MELVFMVFEANDIGKGIDITIAIHCLKKYYSFARQSFLFDEYSVPTLL